MSRTGGNVVSGFAPPRINDGAMMVRSADGLPAIAYDNVNTNDLKVVKCSNSGCANP